HYFKAGRQTITNTSSPQDFYGKFPVVAPGGGGHSLKLGDSLGNHGIDRVQYVINVPNTPNNDYAIRFQYAVVYQAPTHPQWEQPRFTISIIDAATNQPYKDGCYDLNFVADPNNMTGFFQSTERS